MNLIAQLFAHVRENPAEAITLLGPVLGSALGGVLVSGALQALPAGAFKTYAEAHPDEVLAVVRAELALLQAHPDLVKAAAGQFAH